MKSHYFLPFLRYTLLIILINRILKPFLTPLNLDHQIIPAPIFHKTYLPLDFPLRGFNRFLFVSTFFLPPVSNYHPAALFSAAPTQENHQPEWSALPYSAPLIGQPCRFALASGKLRRGS
jgi:hypothetical protein